MKDKVVMITGANSGIGKVTALELAKLGAEVIMVCRNEEKAIIVQREINSITNQKNVQYLIADFSKPDSIQKMADDFEKRYQKLDVLINNAGLVSKYRKENLLGIEYTMAVNHFGYFLTTHYLLNSLRESKNARIINVSSDAHESIKEIDWNNLNAEKKFNSRSQYGLTKLFNIYFTTYLAEYFSKEPITVNCLHPGFVKTNFSREIYSPLVFKFRNLLASSPEKGAETSIYLASSIELENVRGKYFVDCRVTQPSTLAMDDDIAKKVWEWTIQKTGISSF